MLREPQHERVTERKIKHSLLALPALSFVEGSIVEGLSHSLSKAKTFRLFKYMRFFTESAMRCSPSFSMTTVEEFMVTSMLVVSYCQRQGTTVGHFFLRYAYFSTG